MTDRPEVPVRSVNLAPHFHGLDIERASDEDLDYIPLNESAYDENGDLKFVCEFKFSDYWFDVPETLSDKKSAAIRISDDHEPYYAGKDNIENEDELLDWALAIYSVTFKKPLTEDDLVLHLK